jgi:hypothetical protein
VPGLPAVVRVREEEECWVCESTDIVYMDALKMPWCREHYQSMYLSGDFIIAEENE